MPEFRWHGWAVRAFQAWPLLTFAARHHQLFTYQELGEHLGLPAVAVGDALGPIHRYCVAHQLPLLNVLVISKEDGKPKYGELGNVDVLQEQARVFAHTWINREDHAAAVPSIEDFQEIVTHAAA